MKVKKNQLTGIIVLAIAVVVAIVLFMQPPTPTTSGAKAGDMIKIEYTITLDDGTVFDTTDVELAQRVNLSVFQHGSYEYLIGTKTKYSNEYPFDTIVLGLREGDTLTKYVEPEELPPTTVLNRVKSIDRISSFPQEPKLPPNQFGFYFGDAHDNETVTNPDHFPWNFTILKVFDDGWVRLHANVEAGDTFVLPGNPWNSTITDITTKIIYMRHDPAENQIIRTYLGTTEVINITHDDIVVRRTPVEGAVVNTGQGQFVVTNVTADEIFMRPSRSVLEEKPFTIDLKVLSLTKNVRQILEENDIDLESGLDFD